MNKRLVTVFVVVLLVIGGIVGWFYFSSRTIRETQKTFLRENLPSKNLKEYQDEAGFSFSYPEELTIIDKKESEDASYADLAITSSRVSGGINLRIVDAKFKSLEDWGRENLATDSSKKDIVLANIPAWEVKKNADLLTVGLDQGILFQIEVLPEKEEAFWSSVYKTLILTFSFALPEESVSGGVSSERDGEVVFEGEEVIE